MASRLLNRSKTLALSGRRLLHPSTPIDPVASSALGTRALVSLASHPLSHPRSSPVPRPDLPSSAGSLLASAPGLARGPVFGHFGSGKNMSTVVSGAETNCLKGKENDSSKVIAFSPLEGTLAKERKSVLSSESLKVKRMELSIKTTYALIPALLLVSKTKLTTSMLVLCVYWQAYGFFKEIFLDYVHHEVTRKWVLIYFKLLLFILAKDAILAFGLV